MEFDELLITTGVDALVRLVKEKQRIELDEASAILNIPPETLEDWARVLEEQGILRIEYRLTRIYLMWIKPTPEEIATERESFYEEKEDIQKQVEAFKEKMGSREEDLENLQKSFSEFYSRTYAKLEELEKVVAPLPAGEFISQGTFTKGEQELAVMRSELKNVKEALREIRDEIKSAGISTGESESEALLTKVEAVHKDLVSMQGEMAEIKKRAAAVTPSDVQMPSLRDIKRKMEMLKKEFASLKSRNARLREDMVSLHESSQILHDVAESVMGQEEKIAAIKAEVAAAAKEADKLLEKTNEVTEKARQNLEMVERVGDSVTVAKGIIKRFPTQQKVLEELDGLKRSEELIEEKYKSLEKLMDAVGGKKVSAKQFTELAKKMEIKMDEVRREMDSLETALEDEKSTYLTFQQIKERIVPAIATYDRKLGEMEQRITEIGKEAVAQKESLRKDAKMLQESLKGKDVKDVMKVAEEVRDKKKMLGEIKKSLEDLVILSDNLRKRITLLSREAKLLQIRAGAEEEAAAPTPEKEEEIRRQLKLTNDEEMEFRKKREELKKLIKRLWEE